jgi:hypothetical protein
MSSQEEALTQVAISNYIKLNYPGTLFTISIAGAKLSVGQWIKLNKMGYSKGTPDIFIFEPRNGYHGLMIELKRKKGGHITEEQQNWLVNLNTRKYFAECCHGLEEAKKVIDNYLNLPY